MKHAILVGTLVVALANAASAQITDVHTRCGENGGSFSLAAGTMVHNYEATISSCLATYIATLDVYHNGVLMASIPQVGIGGIFLFSAPVDMSRWGLKCGDKVTFRLKVVNLLGGLLATHSLTGVVE